MVDEPFPQLRLSLIRRITHSTISLVLQRKLTGAEAPYFRWTHPAEVSLTPVRLP